MQEPLQTAILDDGVCELNLRNTSGCTFSHYFVEQGRIVTCHGHYNRITHGTVCASIFCEYTIPCHVHDICVFPQNSGIDLFVHEQVNTALDWCYRKRIKLIFMSIGTMSRYKLSVLAAKIDKMAEKSIIVAACCNTNAVTFPASLPNVIGVRSATPKPVDGKYTYHMQPYDGIDIAATLPSDCGPIIFYEHATATAQTLTITNSYATPYIAGLIAGRISNDTTLEQTRLMLMHGSRLVQSVSPYPRAVICHIDCDCTEVPLVLFDKSVPRLTKQNLVRRLRADGYCCGELSDYTDILNEVMDATCAQLSGLTDRQLIEHITACYLPDIVFLHEEYLSGDISLLPDIDIFVVGWSTAVVSENIGACITSYDKSDGGLYHAMRVAFEGGETS